MQILIEIGLLGISRNFFGSKLGAENELGDTTPILIKKTFLSGQNGDFSSRSQREINVVVHWHGVRG